MPNKSLRPLSASEKAAIITLRAENYTVASIARKLNRTPRPIFRFLKIQRDLAAKAGVLDVDFRETMKVKAVEAVNDGLDCKDDPYKRGNLGKGVLVGLQVFAPDSQLNINQLISTIPPEWKDRYIISNEQTLSTTEEQP